MSFDERAGPVDQWWKLKYNHQAEPAVAAEVRALPEKLQKVANLSQKVEEEQVLREMWEASKSPALVYATDMALNAPKLALNPVLDRFVQADNKAFRRELETENVEVIDSFRSPLDPMSPSKRKHRDSMDSMDSNHASVDSMDVANGFDDDPFADEYMEPIDHFGTEMQVMSQELDLSDEQPPLMPPRPGSSKPQVSVKDLTPPPTGPPEVKSQHKTSTLTDVKNGDDAES